MKHKEFNLSEDQYNELCTKCDLILNENIENPFRVANNWLHIIRNHPITLSKYNYIFSRTNLFKFYLICLGRFCYYVGMSFLRFFKLKQNHINKFKDLKFKNIFISHFFGNNHFIKNEDFYYFKLPIYMQRGNTKSLIVYINHRNKILNITNSGNDNLSRYILPKYLSFNEELKITWLLLKDAIKILFRKNKSITEKKINFQAFVESLSPASHFNYRLANQVEELTKKFQPKNIFTTFEGHPWERLIYFSTKKIRPEINNIAFQHSFVFNKQHAIKRSLGYNYEPDFVFCSGIDGKEKLKNSKSFSNKKIFVIGTERILSRSSEFKPKVKRDSILILPEGDLIECYPLVDLAYKLSNLKPELKFILRFHPITDIEKLKKAKTYLKKPSKNIEISKFPISKDFKRCHYAIYRGSTTIIKAIQNGLIPIYYKKKGEMNIDPLDSLFRFKKIISQPEDIFNIINIDEKENIKNQKELVKGVQKFFSPIDYSKINLIKSAKE